MTRIGETTTPQTVKNAYSQTGEAPDLARAQRRVDAQLARGKIDAQELFGDPVRGYETLRILARTPQSELRRKLGAGQLQTLRDATARSYRRLLSRELRARLRPHLQRLSRPTTAEQKQLRRSLQITDQFLKDGYYANDAAGGGVFLKGVEKLGLDFDRKHMLNPKHWVGGSVLEHALDHEKARLSDGHHRIAAVLSVAKHLPEVGGAVSVAQKVQQVARQFRRIEIARGLTRIGGDKSEIEHTRKTLTDVINGIKRAAVEESLERAWGLTNTQRPLRNGGPVR